MVSGAWFPFAGEAARGVLTNAIRAEIARTTFETPWRPAPWRPQRWGPLLKVVYNGAWLLMQDG